MPYSPVGTDLDQSSNVAVNLATKIPLNHIILVDDLANPVDLLVGKLGNLGPRATDDICFVQNLISESGSDPIDPTQSHVRTLIIRYIYASYSDHWVPS